MERENTQHDEEKLKSAQEAFTNDSAFMIAWERALETSKGEKGGALIQDPFAKLLAGSKGKKLSDDFGPAAAVHYGLWPDFHKQWTVVRTKFIDECLQRLSAPQQENDSAALQFVNLGAGLDTRCYRLECSTTWDAAFEVDMPELNGPKATMFEALQAPLKVKQYHMLSADLTEEGALAKTLELAHFDLTARTVFLAEGLIMYLGDKQAQFIQEVSDLASPGSALILNFMPQPTLSKKQLETELLAGGWSNLEWNKFGDEVLNYGRFPTGEYEPSEAFSFVLCFKN